MQFKTKALVAALAFVAAGAANAAISTAASNDSSLILFVTAPGAGNVTALFDLGVDFNSFAPALQTTAAAWTTNGGNGVSATWDLTASTLSSNNGVSTALTYGSEYTKFLTAAAGSDVTWGVLAARKSGTDSRALQTLNSNNIIDDVAGTPTSGIVSYSAQFDKIVNASNTIGTNKTAANGASVNTEGAASQQGVLKANTVFGADYTWGGNAGFSTNGADGESLAFAYVDNAAGASNAVQFGSTNADGSFNAATFTFNVASGTLTYAVAPVVSVPEPETYAMLLAGLGMVGLMARRRRA